jgi:MFS transporter, LPLT family, lysophospholipid transporter
LHRGFYILMAAQFFSSLADNALFLVAIEMLRVEGAPAWQGAATVPMFALFYVILAPFVGAFADYIPKGRVMFIANAIKVVGCLLMLSGLHPLLAVAIVGLGAAAYSPAKYGILTEMLPASRLVAANGWIEGLTVGSIVMGVVLGGQLVGKVVSGHLLAYDVPFFETGIDTAPEAALAVLIALYIVAAVFNTFIPRTSAALQRLPPSLGALLADFWRCNTRLWRDKLGQISLSTTTLFWGVSGNLRVIVLAWAAAALGYGTTEASTLQGVVAVGTAVGAIVASLKMRLDHAPRVIPLGVAMGILVIFMIFIKNVWVAAPFLIVLGAIGGFLVVPMNALLQHRGHSLMGAGRSIAVQNFNEQACILVLGAFYTALTRFGLSSLVSISIFGVVVAGTMWIIGRWHASNCARYPAEMDHLLAAARAEKH